MLVPFIEVRVCPRIELYLIIKTTKFFRNTLLLLAQIFRTRLISPFAHISLPRPLNLNTWNKLLALHLKMLRLRTAWNRSIFFIIFRYLLGATTSAVLASRGRYCDTTHHPVPCTNLLVCYVWWWQVNAKLHPPCSTTWYFIFAHFRSYLNLRWAPVTNFISARSWSYKKIRDCEQFVLTRNYFCAMILCYVLYCIQTLAYIDWAKIRQPISTTFPVSSCVFVIVYNVLFSAPTYVVWIMQVFRNAGSPTDHIAR